MKILIMSRLLTWIYATKSLLFIIIIIISEKMVQTDNVNLIRVTNDELKYHLNPHEQYNQKNLDFQ